LCPLWKWSGIGPLKLVVVIIAGIVTEMAVTISSFLPVHENLSAVQSFVRGGSDMPGRPIGERSSAHMHSSFHRQVIRLI
jgi:hypothetical protein